MARPRQPRFRATTESEVVAFMLGGPAEIIASGDPDWGYWILSSASREVALAELRADERRIFDPGYEAEDEAGVAIAVSENLRDLRPRGRRVASATRRQRPSLVTVSADETNAPTRLTPIEFNRYRRGLLVLSEDEGAWARACDEQPGGAELTTGPTWSFRLARRLHDAARRAARAGPDVKPRQYGRHPEGRTRFMEWLGAFGLPSSRASAYAVPPANIVAALAAIAPSTIGLPTALCGFFTAPDDAERSWEFALANFRDRR